MSPELPEALQVALRVEVSDRQWNDLLGLVRVQGERLDLAYIRQWATVLEVEELLNRLLGG